MKRFKIKLTEVSRPQDKYESWDATVEGFPGAEVTDAPSAEKALKIAKAKALRLIAILVESDQLDFDQLELSQCCHEPIKNPVGYTHCHVCERSIPHGISPTGTFSG